MNTYACDTFRPVRAPSFKEAADIFADRLARRQNKSKSNLYSSVRQDSWANGSIIYEFTYGYYDKKNDCAVVESSYHNVSIC
jgi:hypothetical protein